jgi:hypothetical protein
MVQKGEGWISMYSRDNTPPTLASILPVPVPGHAVRVVPAALPPQNASIVAASPPPAAGQGEAADAEWVLVTVTPPPTASSHDSSATVGQSYEDVDGETAATHPPHDTGAD